MGLNADILRGYTDAIILRRLRNGSSWGYAVNKQISTLSGGEVELKEATLYTAFRRLEQQGLIESYWGSEETGARRRYYTLTPLGEARVLQDQEAWRETKQLLVSLLEDNRDEP